mmetsp:Transcript_68275/g.172731  ORF Transcript_68275/g.172731 Transcript_68275/m.172731 type:complete len:277 (-) Transcript_68275:1229-2059(-)
MGGAVPKSSRDKASLASLNASAAALMPVAKPKPTNRACNCSVRDGTGIGTVGVGPAKEGQGGEFSAGIGKPNFVVSSKRRSSRVSVPTAPPPAASPPGAAALLQVPSVASCNVERATSSLWATARAHSTRAACCHHCVATAAELPLVDGKGMAQAANPAAIGAVTTASAGVVTEGAMSKASLESAIFRSGASLIFAEQASSILTLSALFLLFSSFTDALLLGMYRSNADSTFLEIRSSKFESLILTNFLKSTMSFTVALFVPRNCSTTSMNFSNDN